MPSSRALHLRAGGDGERSAGAHGIPRIDHQIQQNLLQLVRVCAEQRQRGLIVVTSSMWSPIRRRISFSMFATIVFRSTTCGEAPACG